MFPDHGLAGWFPDWAILSNDTPSISMLMAGSFWRASPQGESPAGIAESAVLLLLPPRLLASHLGGRSRWLFPEVSLCFYKASRPSANCSVDAGHLYTGFLQDPAKLGVLGLHCCFLWEVLDERRTRKRRWRHCCRLSMAKTRRTSGPVLPVS